MKESDLKKYGSIIKNWRKKEGYTIKNFAQFINISPRSLSSVEKGENVNTKYYIDAFKYIEKRK